MIAHSLSRIRDSQTNEYVNIIIDGYKTFKIPKLFACFLSPKIYQSIQENVSMKSFTIQIPKHLNPNKYFTIIDSIFLGSENSTNVDLTNEIGTLFQNEELINLGKHDISINNVVAKLSEKYENGCLHNESQEISFYAQHFEELKESINILDTSIIILILGNPKLQISSEDSLWKIVKERLNQSSITNLQRIELLKLINIDNLSHMYFSEYINTLSNNDFNELSELWNSLKPYVMKEKSQVTYYPFNEWKGIFHGMTEKYGKNCYDSGEVTLSSNSPGEKTELRTIVDFETEDYFSPSNKPNQWIDFDFGCKKVQLEGYSIRINTGCGLSAIRNWKLLGFLDHEWIMLDEQKDNTTIESLQTFSQHIENLEKYSKFRILISGKSNRQTYFACFSNVEFYGTLYEY